MRRRLRHLALNMLLASAVLAPACGGSQQVGLVAATFDASQILNFQGDPFTVQSKDLNRRLGASVCGGTGSARESGFPENQTMPYEWAPILPGSPKPTLHEPQFVVRANLVKWIPPGSDIMSAHPFGADYSMDLRLDTQSMPLYLSYAHAPFHAEIEHGMLPLQDLGWNPVPQDSVLLKGDFIMDCGHPAEYHTEIHPPSFLALGRSSRFTYHGVQGAMSSTSSIAIAPPYRTTQLYNFRDSVYGADINSDARLTHPDTKDFQGLVHDEVNKAAILQSYQLEAHALLTPARFDHVEWSVCAPRPQPPGTHLDIGYQFTTRTGISIRPQVDSARGCLNLTAVESANYRAYPLVGRRTVTWPWAEINREASNEKANRVDVQARIYDDLCRNHGLCVKGTNPGIEADPGIDQYPDLRLWRHPLHIPSVGNGVFPSVDDQPFPFFGFANVGWSLPFPHLSATPANVLFKVGGGSQRIYISNDSDFPSGELRATLEVTGQGARPYFAIGDDVCSKHVLAPHKSCSLVVGAGGFQGGVARLTVRYGDKNLAAPADNLVRAGEVVVQLSYPGTANSLGVHNRPPHYISDPNDYPQTPNTPDSSENGNVSGPSNQRGPGNPSHSDNGGCPQGRVHREC